MLKFEQLVSTKMQYVRSCNKCHLCYFN